jgi:putative ABC transport system ATP-binding protein
MTYIVDAKNIRKSFTNGEITTHVLKGVDLKVRQGEFLSIMGRSGAGKSTLLYQLSLLDDPTAGEIHIEGRDVLKLSNDEKTKFRLNHMGYVFQDYALMPELTALENAAIPLLMHNNVFQLLVQSCTIQKFFSLMSQLQTSTQNQHER